MIICGVSKNGKVIDSYDVSRELIDSVKRNNDALRDNSFYDYMVTHYDYMRNQLDNKQVCISRLRIPIAEFGYKLSANDFHNFNKLTKVRYKLFKSIEEIKDKKTIKSCNDSKEYALEIGIRIGYPDEPNKTSRFLEKYQGDFREYIGIDRDNEYIGLVMKRIDSGWYEEERVIEEYGASIARNIEEFVCNLNILQEECIYSEDIKEDRYIARKVASVAYSTKDMCVSVLAINEDKGVFGYKQDKLLFEYNKGIDEPYAIMERRMNMSENKIVTQLKMLVMPQGRLLPCV